MAEAATAVITQQSAAPSLLSKFAGRFGVEPNKLMTTLKSTAFKVRDGEATNEQMMALMIVADQYGLNPFTKEIYAFPDKGGIVPVVGVDGWSRIINEHQQFDGLEFEYGPPSEKHKQAPEWVECIIYRKDRSHPTRVRERLVECARDTQPWGSHPSRMLRHKALIQCARAAFGFAGIYDEDEAQRIVERDVTPAGGDSAVSSINAAIAARKAPAGNVIDAEPTPQTDDAATGAAEPAEAKPAPARGKGAAKADAAPTFAYVADLIAKAATPEAIEAAKAAIPRVADEGHRAQLDVEARAKSKAISAALDKAAAG